LIKASVYSLVPRYVAISFLALLTLSISLYPTWLVEQSRQAADTIVKGSRYVQGVMEKGER
ncbi:MAG: hypothetical protein NZ480_01140, partial [Bdellovibrionaceae bacterium]|nr:hypothetical protein [Pseudobdellovibrionaceae bacterium]